MTNGCAPIAVEQIGMALGKTPQQIQRLRQEAVELNRLDQIFTPASGIFANQCDAPSFEPGDLLKVCRKSGSNHEPCYGVVSRQQANWNRAGGRGVREVLANKLA